MAPAMVKKDGATANRGCPFLGGNPSNSNMPIGKACGVSPLGRINDLSNATPSLETEARILPVSTGAGTMEARRRDVERNPFVS